MGIDDAVIIDLTEFGGEGYLELACPPLRKKDRFKREATSKIIKNGADGKPTIDKTNMYDYNLVMMMSYVESGPFSDVDSFYDYTDTLDAKKRGSGEKLYNKMVEAIDRIEKGETSPFAGSPGAE